jgi:hypothetical protein
MPARSAGSVTAAAYPVRAVRLEPLAEGEEHEACSGACRSQRGCLGLRFIPPARHAESVLRNDVGGCGPIRRRAPETRTMNNVWRSLPQG